MIITLKPQTCKNRASNMPTGVWLRSLDSPNVLCIRIRNDMLFFNDGGTHTNNPYTPIDLCNDTYEVLPPGTKIEMIIPDPGRELN